jgi:GTP-dependent dephospho-CoA kinase
MRSASSNGDLHDLRLRAEQRQSLAKPMGPVLTERAARDALASVRAPRGLATCGDVVTATLLKWGLDPFVAVVDGKTLRDRPFPLSEFDAFAPGRRFSARNPAGEITAELQSTIRRMVAGDGGLLVVEGEEDLAVLPLARELPLGSTLIYGQPGAGLCFLTLDRAVKERVKSILDGMEARPSEHGH